MITKYSSKLTDEFLEKRLALGVTDEKTLAEQFRKIHETAWGSKPAQTKHFKKYLSEGKVFSDVHPLLMEFVGAYEIESIEIPDWFKVFKNDLIMWICDMLEQHNPEVNEEISNFNNDRSVLSKNADKIIDIIYEINHITPKSFDAGKLNDGRKIIKSIISAIEVGIGKKDLNPEGTGWYKSYQANKLEGGGKKITITHANIAKLGISSLFSGHSASSCQKIERNRANDNNYYDTIYNNISDENMVVMFEEGAPIHFYTLKDADVKYTSMKWRSMLRLVKLPEKIYKCSNCGDSYSTSPDTLCHSCYMAIGNKRPEKQELKHEYGIMIDTFYPNANDFKQAYTVVKEIADKLDIPVLVSERSHYTQTGSQTKLTLDKEGLFYGVFEFKNPMTNVTECTKCKRKRTYLPCDNCKPFNNDICSKCKEFEITKGLECIKCEKCERNTYCTIGNCEECPWASCNSYFLRTPYFDQLSGSSVFNLMPDKTLEMHTRFSILKGVR